jgi:hypothetical protein
MRKKAIPFKLCKGSKSIKVTRHMRHLSRGVNHLHDGYKLFLLLSLPETVAAGEKLKNYYSRNFKYSSRSIAFLIDVID